MPRESKQRNHSRVVEAGKVLINGRRLECSSRGSRKSRLCSRGDILSSSMPASRLEEERIYSTMVKSLDAIAEILEFLGGKIDSSVRFKVSS